MDFEKLLFIPARETTLLDFLKVERLEFFSGLNMILLYVKHWIISLFESIIVTSDHSHDEMTNIVCIIEFPWQQF